MHRPQIIYGTAWKKERTTSLVIQAVLQGFRGIDTACQPKHYREDLVGEALKKLYAEHNITRSDLFLQTKFTSIHGQDRSQPLPYEPTSTVREQVLQSFQVSLKNLKTDYIDSYILHSPLETWNRTVEAWTTLMHLQDEGKVKMIGISNAYDVELLRSLGEIRKVQVVQNRWYEGNHWDADVCNYCREHGVQYQSFWTLTGSPALLQHPALLALANEASCTPAQAVYRLAQLRGIVPLAGSTNRERMRQGVETDKINFPDTPSSAEQLQALNALISNK
ncbi:Aldo/keto reductase [Hysterangium stoloniferum]|nr:Aldo/keto reductase [Hysterangium stoloniferum]